MKKILLSVIALAIMTACRAQSNTSPANKAKINKLHAYINKKGTLTKDELGGPAHFISTTYQSKPMKVEAFEDVKFGAWVRLTCGACKQQYYLDCMEGEITTVAPGADTTGMGAATAFAFALSK